MPPQFLGNPYDREEEWEDSDLELNRDEGWITLPNDLIIMEGRDAPNLIIDIADDDILTDDDSGDWLDNTDDEDYNPDNEDYEETEAIEDLQEEMNDSVSSDPPFYGLYEEDDDDDDEIDYVTYPLNDNETATENTSKTTTTTTESNCNNLTTDTDTD